MSNYGKYAATVQQVNKKASLIATTKREKMTWVGRLTNYFQKNKRLEIYHDVPSTSTQAADTFRGDFSGWQFRMHKAVGGTILEAWRSNHYNMTKGIPEQDHELFIINNSEDLNIELPQILTQLALRQ